MQRLAIIPARGGSKRIPKKNIKEFLGKPIISYAIKNAINSDLFDEVMVSTDDIEIAAISKSYGANIPFIRSSKTADDYATTIEVISEVLNEYQKRGKTFNEACCIYPCTPLLQLNRLIESFKLLEKNNYDCVFPILRYGFPIQRAVRLNGFGKVEMIHPKHLTTRSQDLEPSYHDAGQFYSFNVDKMILHKKLLTENTGYIELSEMEAQDIDNLIDWELAEVKYKIKNNK